MSSMDGAGASSSGRVEWFCVNWPNTSGSDFNRGCKLEVPWAFRAMQNVSDLLLTQVTRLQARRQEQRLHAPYGSVASVSDSTSKKGGIVFPAVQQFLPQVQGLRMTFGQWGKKTQQTTDRASLSSEEQGDAEERALALALVSRKRAIVLEFYSPKCTLCRSLLRLILEVEHKNKDWLSIVMADVENKRWLPEVLLYDIKYVPCFVLLDARGNALAKTGVPYSRAHVVKGLSYLLESMRPIRSMIKRVEPPSSSSE